MSYTPSKNVTLIPTMQPLQYDVQFMLTPKTATCTIDGVSTGDKTVYNLHDQPYGAILYDPKTGSGLAYCESKGKEFVGWVDENGIAYNVVGNSSTVNTAPILSPSFVDLQKVTLNLCLDTQCLTTSQVYPNTTLTSSVFNISNTLLQGYTLMPMEVYEDSSYKVNILGKSLNGLGGRAIQCYTRANPIFIFKDTQRTTMANLDELYRSYYHDTKKIYTIPFLKITQMPQPASVKNMRFRGWRDIISNKIYTTINELKPDNTYTFEPVYENIVYRVTLDCKQVDDWKNTASETQKVHIVNAGESIQLEIGPDIDWCKRDGYEVTGWKESEQFEPYNNSMMNGISCVPCGGHLSRISYLLLIILSLVFFAIILISGLWSNLRANRAMLVDTMRR